MTKRRDPDEIHDEMLDEIATLRGIIREIQRYYADSTGEEAELVWAIEREKAPTEAGA